MWHVKLMRLKLMNAHEPAWTTWIFSSFIQIRVPTGYHEISMATTKSKMKNGYTQQTHGLCGHWHVLVQEAVTEVASSATMILVVRCAFDESPPWRCSSGALKPLPRRLDSSPGNTTPLVGGRDRLCLLRARRSSRTGAWPERRPVFQQWLCVPLAELSV